MFPRYTANPLIRKGTAMANRKTAEEAATKAAEKVTEKQRADAEQAKAEREKAVTDAAARIKAALAGVLHPAATDPELVKLRGQRDALNAKIAERERVLAAAVEIEAAALRQAETELGVGMAAAVAKTGGGGKRRSPDEIKQLQEQVRLHLKAHPQQTKGEIAAALGLDPDDLLSPLWYLKDAGEADNDGSRGQGGARWSLTAKGGSHKTAA
jgi:hypothetical protein